MNNLREDITLMWLRRALASNPYQLALTIAEFAVQFSDHNERARKINELMYRADLEAKKLETAANGIKEG